MALVGPIVLLPFAAIPLCSGIGILRRRVWSAYGFAAYQLAQLLVLPVFLFRPGYSAGGAVKLIVSAVFSLLLSILFFYAGRLLAASGAPRGSAFPWILIAALTTIPLFFVQPFMISSGSMENTLLPGDSIFVQTFPVYIPARGEMIIFKSPMDRNESIVKRVIAVPGDHIRISQKIVILNGAALDEKYVVHKADIDDFYPDELPSNAEIPGCAKGTEMFSQHIVNGEIVVPAGGYFVLGDNRGNSLDSRCNGFVDKDDLIGKPLMIYDSVDETAEQASNQNLIRTGNTRWARLFTFL